LADAPQYRRQPVDIVAALKLSFVPPGSASVGQRCDEVACLGGVARAGAAEDDLKRAVLPVFAALMDIGDQVTDLIDGWDMPMRGGGE
jgi:hypothetical protein